MKKFLSKYKFDVLIGLIIVASVFFDLLSKVLTDGKYDIKVFGDLLQFSSTHNYGAAYGIFSGQSIALIVVTIVVLALIFVYNHFKKNKTILYSVSLGLIVGGAIGNLVDRIFFGYVRDFIKFSFFSFNCNVADICLTFGVIIFAIYLIFFDKTARKSEANNDK